MLPYSPLPIKPGDNVVQVIEDKQFYPWGGKLYPSGEFVLWRKQREQAKRQKESFISACTWLFGGRMLDEVQEVWGVEAIHRYWKMASELDVQRVRPYPACPIESCPIDGGRWYSGLMGLSAPSNSQKKRRGLGGITRHGRTLVREAAVGLEQRYGKECLSFWTCTLPALPEEDMRVVCENWSALLKNVKEKLLYHLEKKGLPPHIVGVTEMQTERYERTGEPAWHAHFVFVGRHPFQSWSFTPSDLDKLWREAVEELCTTRPSFYAACRVESIRMSVGGYLAKYLSKGSAVSRIAEELGEWCVPSSWYICTKGLRSWVKQNTRSSEGIARWLYQCVQSIPKEIAGLWAYCLETRPGCQVAVCWLGRILDPYPPRIPLP